MVRRTVPTCRQIGVPPSHTTAADKSRCVLPLRNFKMFARVILRFRFGEDAPLALKHLIRPDHQRIHVALRYLARLHLCERIRQITRTGAFCFKAVADGFLIHTTGSDIEIQTRIPQHGGSDLGRRGKDDAAVLRK
jgi:hypothetical protein